jgi:hypothetical protein
MLIAPGAFSQVATNFISPKPTWRNIGGQIYDIKSLPSVRVPLDLSYHAVGYNGVPNQLITLEGFIQENPPKSVTFENFSFDPKDFSLIHGINGLQPVRQLYCRALKTTDITNWNVLSQPISIDIVYDCGQAVTNPIAIPANPPQ